MELSAVLAPHPAALAVALVIDSAVGDPDYRAHPVRLMGGALLMTERALREFGAGGYGGGVPLFLALATMRVGGASVAVLIARDTSVWRGWSLHLYILYSLLALGSLLAHGWQVETALVVKI